jgi:hypothetical protein
VFDLVRRHAGRVGSPVSVIEVLSAEATMGAHAEHTDHESTAARVTLDRSPAPTAVQRAPSGGASTSSRGIVRPGLEEAIARASSTRGPMTVEPQGRIQRSALASPAASVGRDPSGAIRRVDIQEANAKREQTRVLLQAEVQIMGTQFDALMSILPQIQSLSMMAITQPALLGQYFAQLPSALAQIELIARRLERVTTLLDARRPEIISPMGKEHLRILDAQLDLLRNDLYVWRAMVAAAPPGSSVLYDVLGRASYHKATISTFMGPLLLQNEDEIKGIPTAPPPPPPMSEQEIMEGVREQEHEEEMKGQKIMDGMRNRGIMGPADNPDPRAVAQKAMVVQDLKQRDN